jgi:hypothetical protein
MNEGEGQENAKRHDAYMREILSKRWLSTLVLSMHLEIEATLTVMLYRTLPKPERLLNGKGPSFSHKLVICDSLDLLEEDTVNAVRALNKMRNSFSHNMDQELPIRELITFLAAMGPMGYTSADGSKRLVLDTFQKFSAHFENEGREELEEHVFFCTRLLLAKLTVRLKSLPNN